MFLVPILIFFVFILLNKHMNTPPVSRSLLPDFLKCHEVIDEGDFVVGLEHTDPVDLSDEDSEDFDDGVFHSALVLLQRSLLAASALESL